MLTWSEIFEDKKLISSPDTIQRGNDPDSKCCVSISSSDTTNNQSNKLILGIPYYGYEWQSSSSMAGANTIGVGQAKFYNEMEGLAQSY